MAEICHGTGKEVDVTKALAKHLFDKKYLEKISEAIKLVDELLKK